MNEELNRRLPLIARTRIHKDRVAVRDKQHRHTYRDILDRSVDIAASLLDTSTDLSEERIAFLVPAGFDYVCTQWAIWRAGGIAVPISLSATEPEIRYTLTDADVSCLVVTADLQSRMDSLCKDLKKRMLVVEDVKPPVPYRDLPNIAAQRRAMILYTSGTTGKPKGVVSTHETIQAQIETLVDAWQWQADDSIPLFLPLHHIHGIINIMSCALWSGATIEPFPRFEMETVLQRVAAGVYSVFMAVPTIYVKIIQHLANMEDTNRRPIIDGFSAMRLMVSGSAALPASVHQTWRNLTGQSLLERYGMTEIGMALSNPYEGERRPGSVGQPLPRVQVRLMSESGKIVSAENEPGEIQVHGPCVFREYWNRPDATHAALDDGWFGTGDIARLKDGYFQIMGRQSVDIIKSGGYKLSALEIESVLLDHPAIRECAVIGLADDTWGEVVAAVVVLSEDSQVDWTAIRDWCEDRLSAYKIPRRWKAVDGLPRNAMGKVTKPAVKDLFETPESAT